MNQNEHLEYLVNSYADAILRLSYSYLKNLEDAKDVCQTVFIKLITNEQSFKTKEHEKAFILRTTANVCKDILKSAWRKRTCNIEHCGEIVAPTEEEDSVLWAVNQLPDKYRAVIYLHYYEGYKASEIAKIVGTPTATVHTRLVRARKQLKELLEGEQYETV